MGLNAGNIYIAIRGDTSPLDKALTSARKQADAAAKKIKSAFGKIEVAAKKAAKSLVTGIGGAISGLAIGALVVTTIQLADSYTLLEARIGLVTDSAAELVAVQDQLFDISQDTRVGYETTVEIFTRLSRATKNVAVSQADMLKVTESLNKAVIVSGATTTEASNALIQLSQGLASNRLGGEELRSVMEQIPRVAQMIADGLGVDIGRFRELSKEGKLTAEVVTKALLSQADVINDEFAKIPITVGQSITMMTNSLGRMVDATNEETNATMSLAKGMAFLSGIIDDNAENMARFIAITVSGLISIAKIAAVGGALYALPLVITKTHEAFVLLNWTVFKLQTGVIGLNTALFGTSVNAQLAAGSLTKVRLAASSMFALFAGFELGKWAYEEFEAVRFVSLWAFTEIDKKAIEFKFNIMQMWVDIKFSALKSADFIKEKMGGVFSSIADTMSGFSVTVANPFGDDFQVGLDSAANKLQNVADKIKSSSSATKEHEAATDALREQMSKAIDVHDGTVKILMMQREWTKKVGESDDEAGGKAMERAMTTVNANLLIDESTKATSELVISTNKKLYEDLGSMGEGYREVLFEQLDEQYAKYEEIGADTLLLDEWYFDQRTKINEKFAAKTITLQDTIAKATSKAAEAGAMAWMRGEDAKMKISTIAADVLTENALKAASEPLKKGLHQLLGDQLGGWIGLGAGESSVEGETWQDRIKNGATYLAQAAAIVIGGKAVGNALYADGGWVGQHPGGGVINKGSGYKDDVFLGLSNGGSVANMGMGGEYVTPRRQTAKYFPILEAIRKDEFAEGGPVGDPVALAHDINGGGFSTFFKEWMDTGNYKQGIKAAIIYYMTTAATMTAGKMWGPEIMNFKDGGITGFVNFAEGGPTVEQYDGSSIDTNITRQVNEWTKSWAGDAGDLVDPLGIAESTDDVINIMNAWVGDLSKSVNLSSESGDSGFKGIWDIDMPVWLDRGMISTSIDTVDRLLIPFTTDILTPGKGHDVPGAIEYQFGDALEESVEQGVKGLLGLELEDDWGDVAKKVWDPLDIFHTGTNFVEKTGPAIIERGERIFTAADNSEIMDILRGKGSGDGVNIKVSPSFTVMFGEQDVTDKIEIIAEGVIVEREERGLAGTGERVKF